MNIQKKLISVPYIDQTVKYPTGCESISTVMLLNYLGYELSPEEFIDRYLPKKDFYCRDGLLYGPDPKEYFIGSPYNAAIGSYGCYAGTILRALEPLVSDDYEIRNETDTPIADLLTRYIDHNMPVIFWATLNMQPAIPGPTWILDGTGAEFSWKNNEHCLLLVGYDADFFYFNDPWQNHGTIAYERALVEQRHAEQYSQAVALIPKQKRQL